MANSFEEFAAQNASVTAAYAKMQARLQEASKLEVVPKQDNIPLVESFDVNATGNQPLFTISNRKFQTRIFTTPEAANDFMQSEEGKDFGFIGTDANGHHCVRMDDPGVAVTND